MNIILSKNYSHSDLVVLPLFKEEKTSLVVKQKIKESLPNGIEDDFKKDLGRAQVVYLENTRVLLLGLGNKRSFSPAGWRTAVHSAVGNASNLGVKSVNIFFPAVSSKNLNQYLELTGYALTFSAYKFEIYKQEPKEAGLENVQIIAPVNQQTIKSLNNGIAIGQACNQARDLANHPGNVATPTRLAKHATEVAKKNNFSCKILGPLEIEKEGLGLLLGVARGSEEPSKFIILDYGPKTKDPIVLIGKGLTFDSGGVSIKPADRMEEMKFDMCGGATVIGIFEAVAKLKLPIRIVGLIPSTENLLSGKAVKPGDVLQAHDKTYVEIINTDAEGRLVLADAISFAQKHYKPRLIIDYATLTGAVLIALGDQYTGYFANTKAYDRAFSQASDKTAEQLWPLPLAPEYKDQLKSIVADIKNIGEKGSAGATTAALFLEHFVKNIPWIHLDIAGTAWTMRPKNFANPGATGWGVYLTVELLRNLK